nr:PREDICTED: lactosylceramide alpha-2,3-sialyltransferase isoform X1 [Lepisosteus oculatus]XP_015200482.1 PREDICTED: lactosylceramide alpha-2,3-sialyltransferase isoform X3 [Lepisosteus oculatus]XP_015200483.1 PREDICTED: lactosylceramide alpha-2,3-sialyltransferase isoform X1 [Lepisosteus oculatus]XP_015200484.1 PREDICTED: lactosylceramide alpha-2,3-sialyltransferase isoform X1 [Lepisosteus oculatus]
MRHREPSSSSPLMEKPHSPLSTMRRTKGVCSGSLRCGVGILVVITLASLVAFMLETSRTNGSHTIWNTYTVDPNHVKLVHSFVKQVLQRECKPSFARKEMEARFSTSIQVQDHFLSKNSQFTETIFQYPPPFGFKDLGGKLLEVLSLFPSPAKEEAAKSCRRCVVIGNGGILRGLELGNLIDQFDVVIRLNSGPLREFSKDVGNKTSIRMSYPEGSPVVWEDVDPEVQFVAVVYKSVDFSWVKAMMKKERVSFWDWLFFWQRVPEEIPIGISQFRILNPEIIRQTALDLLHFPAPQPKIWGWDQNVPTLGISALNLATYLCDEVSLAGFGYNLSQPRAPLHYYEDVSMDAMLVQHMHDVDTERTLIGSLVRAGIMSDLTGGVHCSFCGNDES